MRDWFAVVLVAGFLAAGPAVSAFAQTCGNIIVEAGETCDDGNALSGDCCSSICQYDVSGTPCADDGNPCSADTCDGLGACLHPPGNAGNLCRPTEPLGPENMGCSLGKVASGEMGFPVGISQHWFASNRCGPTSTIRFYPNGDQYGCSGWHTYTERPPTAAKLKQVLDGLRDGSYQSPPATAGSSIFSFVGGTIEARFSDFKNLFDAKKVNGILEVRVPVYEASGCSNPSGSIRIVGFATVQIYEVVAQPGNRISAYVPCRVLPGGEVGGLDFGTYPASCGNCDAPEFCDGLTATCPADQKSPAGTGCNDDGNACTTDLCDAAAACIHSPGNPGAMCRAAAGNCDVAETCDGLTSICPADQFKPQGVQCRSAAGVCDVAESCSGTEASCPIDAFASAALVCRASQGVCDVAETCTGAAKDCPSDLVAAASTVCRAAAGTCDQNESCDGTATTCPADTYATSAVTCRAASGACDVAEQCPGTGPYCPADSFASSGTTCRAAGGVCDVAEVCTGASGTCPADALAPTTTTCRVATSECDAVERCDGSAKDCPVDAFAVAGTVCRSSDGVCDVPENCTGASATCPADAISTPGSSCTSDSNTCTTDQCDSTGACVHSPNSLPCNDGQFCNGLDTCSGGSCSIHAGDPCPGIDGDGNCLESCNEAQGTCTAPDPDDAACDDGDSATVLDKCTLGTCAGTDDRSCGTATPDCPDGCSIENDPDCSVCTSRALSLTGCDIRVKRRLLSSGADKLKARCTLHACDAAGGISLPTEGIRIAVSDAGGPCFVDSLSGAFCEQKTNGYRCRSALSTDAGLRQVKLKTISACEFALSFVIQKADLSCLDSSQSPWVPSLVIGNDCGDVGCPVTSPERLLCPNTCGNDDASDPGEECDGVDDGRCPGLCDPTCTCR